MTSHETEPLHPVGVSQHSDVEPANEQRERHCSWPSKARTALVASLLLSLCVIFSWHRSRHLYSVAPKKVVQFDASSAPTPVTWAISGGGWRAEAAGIGFANAFSQAGLFNMDQLVAVASNSGGSWFLTLFAYSQDFFNQVTGAPESIESFVQSFMNQQYAAANHYTMNTLKAASDVCEKLNKYGMIPENVAGSCVAAKNHGFVWRSLVTDLLKYGGGQDFSTVRADTASRTGLRWPALHFQSSELRSAYIYMPPKEGTTLDATTRNKKPTVTQLVNSAGSPAFGRPIVPVQYVVPGYEDSMNNGMDSGWIRPVGFPTYQEAQKVVALGGYAPADLPPKFNGVTTVADVASSSSAAAAIISSGELLETIVEYVCKPLAPIILDMLPAGLQGLGVCASALYTEDGHEYCPYPAQRMADGAYVDNTAIAQTVGSLQSRYGLSQRLRLVFTDTTQKVNGVDYMGDIKAIMSGASGSSTAYIPGLIIPDSTVFAQNYEDLMWQQVPGSTVTANHDLQYTEVTTTTVSNPTFGVREGTIVDLLIFTTGSNAPMFHVGDQGVYAPLAAAIANSGVAGVLDTWLKNTGGKGDSFHTPGTLYPQPDVPDVTTGYQTSLANAAEESDANQASLASSKFSNIEISPTTCLGQKVCFPGEALAHTKEFGIAPLSSLRPGDEVLVEGVMGVLYYEPIMGFAHRLFGEASNGTFSNLVIVHEHGELRVSANHLVPVRCSEHREYKAAADLRPGDNMFVVASVTASAPTESAVIEIRQGTSESGMFAPLTAAGTIVVDGVVASNYATPNLGKRLSHGVAHATFFPLRMYYRFGVNRLLSPIWSLLCRHIATPHSWFCEGETILSQRTGQVEVHPLVTLMSDLLELEYLLPKY